MKKLLSLLILGSMMSISSYGLSIYSENFESTSGTLADAGYIFGVHRYVEPNAQGSASAAVVEGGTWYTGAQPTGHTAIEASIVAGNDSAVVKYWNDYGHAPNYADNTSLRTNNLKEITLTSDMVSGGTINFSLDYAIDSLGNSDDSAALKQSQGGAFLKVLDSVGGTWSELAYSQLTYDKSASGWNSISGSLTVDSSMAGQLLQFGLFTESQNYADTGVYADNISVSAVPEPSTYALLAGFAAFLFVAIRRRK